ncbi:unnamed protein product [Protopolystoma xenopodis]|uniref:Peptidase M13 N-terminal domain-containing protein n=1 Tax=Protopolystoma xenopodis TaxID=117903 RepID=A0A448XSG9_9PLAT|nr:unnamed protein product [Protopolystoma xenopodis]
MIMLMLILFLILYLILYLRHAIVMFFFLENPETTNSTQEGRAFSLARRYFTACLNTSAVEDRGFRPAKDMLTRLFSGWALLPTDQPGSRLPNDTSLVPGIFDLTEAYARLLEYGRSNSLFSMQLDLDAKSPTVIRIYVSTSLPKLI